MSVWNRPGFNLAPLAPAIGPFCGREFIEAVTLEQSGRALPIESENGFLPLWQTDDEIRFAGSADLTDYRSPLGDDTESLIGRVAGESAPTRFVLDSLPEEAAKPLQAGLMEAGWQVESHHHEVTAVLDLPRDHDDYLSGLSKKERHEVRRKKRRYQGSVGDLVHETLGGEGPGLDEFIRLHGLSSGPKGDFLTPVRCRIFTMLASAPGWRFDLLRTPQGSAAAIVFGYSDDSGYYLYNSAYDPSLRGASPGVVLLGSMIEQAITEKMPRFDFLKGDETYKFRLGARPRPLVEIVAVPGQ